MQEDSNLIVKAVKRVSNKLRDSKVWKKIASLVLAGSIAATFVGCANNSNNSESKNPNESSPINTEVDDIDLSLFSQLTQDILQNTDYCKKQNQLIQSNLNEKDFKLDVYSNPYTFLKEQGYDIEKIKSGEKFCHTSSFVLQDSNKTIFNETEPADGSKNLYMGINIADDTNTYYNQYLIRYTITEQEMEEYYAMHNQSYLQSLYLNDMISKTRTPEILLQSKVNIETYNAIRNNCNNFLIITSFDDYIIKKAGVKNGKDYFEVITYNGYPVAYYNPTENEAGKPKNTGACENKHFVFDDSVEYSLDNDILKVDINTLNEEVCCGQGDDYDGQYGYKNAISYPCQDKSLELFSYVFKPMTKENVQIVPYYKQVFDENGPVYDEEGNLVFDYDNLLYEKIFFTSGDENDPYDRTGVRKINEKVKTKEVE